MKADTVFMFLKGIGLVLSAMASAFVTSLSQWSNDTATPTKIQWWIIFGGTAGAGAAALVAFCSGTASKWKDDRSSGGTQFLTNQGKTP